MGRHVHRRRCPHKIEPESPTRLCAWTPHKRKRELWPAIEGITEEFKVPLHAFCIVEGLHPAVQDSFWFFNVVDLPDAQAVRKTAAIRDAARISNNFSVTTQPDPSRRSIRFVFGPVATIEKKP